MNHPLVVVIVILLLLAILPTWPYMGGLGWYPFGGVLGVILLLVVLRLLGVL